MVEHARAQHEPDRAGLFTNPDQHAGSPDWRFFRAGFARARTASINAGKPGSTDSTAPAAARHRHTFSWFHAIG